MQHKTVAVTLHGSFCYCFEFEPNLYSDLFLSPISPNLGLLYRLPDTLSFRDVIETIVNRPSVFTCYHGFSVTPFLFRLERETQRIRNWLLRHEHSTCLRCKRNDLLRRYVV